jgi:putative membrane protein insertion efficiency factor
MGFRAQKIINWILELPRQPILLLIKVYQKTISPDHGPLKYLFSPGVCRFYPTCSEYGYGVIKKRGLIVGVPLTVWRILRCNPWNEGGFDPVK